MTTKILRTLLLSFMIFSIPHGYAQNNLEKGIDAIKKGEYIKALELLKGVKKDSYDANLYYGIALFETGSLAEAEKSFKAAVRKDDERPEAYSYLGGIFTQQKQYSQAAAQFEKARKYLPLTKSKDDLNKDEIATIITVLKAEAENFISDGKVDKAIASLTQARIYDEKNPIIYIGLGDAYLARGAFEPAKTNYDQALKLKANYAPALYGLGMISKKKKKYSDALEYFLKSTEADNNFGPAYFEKGLIFYLLDRFNDAIEAFERYDKLLPGSLRGKTYLAKAHYGKGEIDIAMKILEEVLAKDSNYSEANKYFAFCLIEKKEYEKALDYFDKVKPEDLNAEDETKIATIYINLKQFFRAYEHLDKAILKDSLEANTYFEYGKAYFGEQKYAEANEKFAKAIELGVINVGTYVYSAISYYYTKEYQQGIDRLNQYLEKDISVAIKSVYLWLGNNYVGLNKNTEACESYKKYLEYEPNEQFVIEQVQKLCEPK